MSVKGLETKQKIIDQSLHLFSVKGYYNTSIKDILEITCLTKGGLYGHFKSKEEIWYATYDQAVTIWKKIVFKDLLKIDNPLKRIEKALDNDLRYYLGKDVFRGGCFFLNMLVELSGQSKKMQEKVLNGMLGFAQIINLWLEEAHEKKMLKENLNLSDISKFTIVSISGCAAMYASTHDPDIWRLTLSQLNRFIYSLKN